MFGFSSDSKSEEACKSFGNLPEVNVNRILISYKAQLGEFPEAAAREYSVERDDNDTIFGDIDNDTLYLPLYLPVV